MTNVWVFNGAPYKRYPGGVFTTKELAEQWNITTTKMALRVDLLFLRPWRPLSGDGAKYFEEELARELAPSHPLQSRRFIAVGITGASDDVLFRLDDGTFAQVHVTFPRTPPETFPGLPRIRIFETLADWRLAVMLPNHVDHFGLWDDGW